MTADGATSGRGRRKWIAAAVVGVLALAGAGWALLRSPSDEPRAAYVPTVAPPPETANPPKVVRHHPLKPPRLEIPAIGVSAPIVYLGLNPDHTLEVPTDFSTVGLWTGGASPGEPGPAVLAGHIDSKAGPAVFYKLDKLKPGDDVRWVRKDHSVVRFVVERLEQVPKNDFPTEQVYGHTDGPTLRLITCGGSFNGATGHYRDNVIAFAREA